MLRFSVLLPLLSVFSFYLLFFSAKRIVFYDRLAADFWTTFNFNIRICLLRRFQSWPYDVVDSTSSDTSSRVPLGHKVVLAWTSIWGDLVNLSSTQHACPDLKCTFSNDRNMAYMADALVFHGHDFCMHDVPKERFLHQRYVFYGFEPPTFNIPDVAIANNFFNWTASYRLDSDIPARYGYLARHMNEDSNQKNQGISTANKTKLAAWFARNCYTPSGRELIVAELQRYIPVHVYGRCGPYECAQKNSAECDRMLGRDYFFYLAFENSNCRDYVTEKFFRALDNQLVPVVLHRSIYDSIAPQDSFIAVDDFPSIKDLASYLVKVQRSPSLYANYMRWRTKFTVAYDNVYCNVCRKLWENGEQSSVYSDLKGWWINDAQCSAQSY